MPIWDDNPPYVFLFSESEWEDYGMGDADGHPFRTGTFLSHDVVGETSLGVTLDNHLQACNLDEETLKAVKAALYEWLRHYSESVSSQEELEELFDLTLSHSPSSANTPSS